MFLISLGKESTSILIFKFKSVNISLLKMMLLIMTGVSRKIFGYWRLVITKKMQKFVHEHKHLYVWEVDFLKLTFKL